MTDEERAMQYMLQSPWTKSGLLGLLEEVRADERERNKAIIAGGHFLTDSSAEKRFADAVIAAIDRAALESPNPVT